MGELTWHGELKASAAPHGASVMYLHQSPLLLLQLCLWATKQLMLRLTSLRPPISALPQLAQCQYPGRLTLQLLARRQQVLLDRLQRLAITTFLLPDWSGQQLSHPLSQLQMQIFTRQAHQRLAHVVKSWYGPILIPHRVLLGLQYLQHSPHLGARLSRRSA